MRVHCGLLITRHMPPPTHRGPRDRQVQCGVHLCTKKKNPKELFFAIGFSNHLTNSLHLIKS